MGLIFLLNSSATLVRLCLYPPTSFYSSHSSISWVSRDETTLISSGGILCVTIHIHKGFWGFGIPTFVVDLFFLVLRFWIRFCNFQHVVFVVVFTPILISSSQLSISCMSRYYITLISRGGGGGGMLYTCIMGFKFTYFCCLPFYFCSRILDMFLNFSICHVCL